MYAEPPDAMVQSSSLHENIHEEGQLVKLQVKGWSEFIH